MGNLESIGGRKGLVKSFKTEHNMKRRNITRAPPGAGETRVMMIMMIKLLVNAEIMHMEHREFKIRCLFERRTFTKVTYSCCYFWNSTNILFLHPTAVLVS